MIIHLSHHLSEIQITSANFNKIKIYKVFVFKFNKDTIKGSTYKYQDDSEINFSLMTDEPDLHSEHFGFDSYAEQIQEILEDSKTPTPFSIAVHGEWGSGKTTLIQRVYENLAKKYVNKDDFNIIWFNAWEYERIDPATALMTKIALQYETRNKKLLNIFKKITLFLTNTALKSTTNVSLEDVQKMFESSIKEIPTIRNELETAIGDNGRLVVIVDDLDRCLVDNSLKILEAVKLFFHAKGIIFLIAVDIEKLERAWVLRYNEAKTASIEGREHLEKIFQLTLYLPKKMSGQLHNYLQNLIPSIPADAKKLLIESFEVGNPRRIKRILNLVYFLNKKHALSKHHFMGTLIVAISTMSFPNLSKYRMYSDLTIPQLALISNGCQNIDDLKSKLGALQMLSENIKHDEKIALTLSISDKGAPAKNNHEGIISGSIYTSKEKDDPSYFSYFDLTLDYILPSTMEGINYIIKEKPEAFNFLRAIGNYIYNDLASSDGQFGHDIKGREIDQRGFMNICEAFGQRLDSSGSQKLI